MVSDGSGLGALRSGSSVHWDRAGGDGGRSSPAGDADGDLASLSAEGATGLEEQSPALPELQPGIFRHGQGKASQTRSNCKASFCSVNAVERYKF